MLKISSDIEDILRLGGSISIDASKNISSNLLDFARLAKISGAMIILRNADKVITPTLKEIARLVPGKVIFEL